MQSTSWIEADRSRTEEADCRRRLEKKNEEEDWRRKQRVKGTKVDLCKCLPYFALLFLKSKTTFVLFAKFQFNVSRSQSMEMVLQFESTWIDRLNAWLCGQVTKNIGFFKKKEERKELSLLIDCHSKWPSMGHLQTFTFWFGLLSFFFFILVRSQSGSVCYIKKNSNQNSSLSSFLFFISLNDHDRLPKKKKKIDNLNRTTLNLNLKSTNFFFKLLPFECLHKIIDFFQIKSISFYLNFKNDSFVVIFFKLINYFEN